MKLDPLEKLARRFMREARSWRNASKPHAPSEYAQGVIRGLHGAAQECRAELAKEPKRIRG